MALPKEITSYHNRKEDLITGLREDTDKILSAIDLDQLLDNPRNYLNILGTAFLDNQKARFRSAFELGEKLGGYMK